MKIDSDQKLNVNTDEIAVYSGCQINWLIYRLLPISGVSCRIFTLLIFNSPGLARGRILGGGGNSFPAILRAVATVAFN